MGAFLVTIKAEHCENERKQNSDRHHESEEHFLVEIIGSKSCLNLHLVCDIVIDLFRDTVCSDHLRPPCVIQYDEHLTVQPVLG